MMAWPLKGGLTAMRWIARRPEPAKHPSPFHPLPLFPLPSPRGEGRGGGELG
jgi:hypothetical protein